MKALYGMGRTVSLQRVLREHRAALLPLAVVLVVNVVALAAVVLPLSQRVSSNEQRAEAAERQRAVAEADFKRAEALQAGQARATRDLETFYQQVLPTSTAAARRILHLKLQQQAREHGVQYKSGGTNEEELRDSSLFRLTTQMQLSGEYDDIRSFIYELETSSDFIVIDQVRLTEGDIEGAPLSVAMNVSTYYRSPFDAATASADAR